MKLYQCHKRVHAAKITDVARSGPWVHLTLEGGVEISLGNMPRFLVAQVGGYFVQYPDGYQSYSPAASFEAGYSEVAQQDSRVGVLSEGHYAARQAAVARIRAETASDYAAPAAHPQLAPSSL